ncbi:MAG TPA: hypothetical protein VFA58_05850 [Chthoniobacterales bacterium]|nr:hypothetical protein [Chthoniobacterales bacterium]
MRTIEVRSITPSATKSFDLALGGVGYERRARYALAELKPRAATRIGLEFEDRQMYDFEDNKHAFEKAKFSRIPARPENVATVLARWICGSTDADTTLRAWIDISSLTRPIIATICYELWAHAQTEERVIQASFVYSQARFSPPPKDYGPIAHKGAVIPEFAGWTDDPTMPCSAIFGIGYEAGLALGALEDLEPAEGWAFRPTGHVSAYDRAINRNNADFLAELHPDHILTYDVNAPLQLVASLESLVYGFLETRRIVIIPFGLKTFALAACLVALQHFPRVNIWRVSSGTLAEPINRLPNGSIVQLDIVFDGTETEMPYSTRAIAPSAFAG